MTVPRDVPQAMPRTVPRRSPLRVTLAVLTYQRPDDLAELLPMLAAQIDRTGPTGGDDGSLEAGPDVGTPTVDILVVDNDPAGSARSFVETQSGAGIRYAHEQTPGISAARNRALDECADRNVIIFIDDDERPVEDWLSSLLAVFLQQNPAGVVGPVVSRYDVPPDAFIEAGRFFDRRRLTTGTPVDVAATNNLLLDLDVIRSLGLRFDEDFGLSGGSDTLFTRELLRRGGVLLWCDEAVVYDIVPASRLTREWVLQRAYRSGNSWSRVAVALSSGGRERAAVRVRLTLKGGVRMLGGVAQIALAVPTRSLRRRARGLRTLRRGQGMIAGAWGRIYSEYRRP